MKAKRQRYHAAFANMLIMGDSRNRQKKLATFHDEISLVEMQGHLVISIRYYRGL